MYLQHIEYVFIFKCFELLIGKLFIASYLELIYLTPASYEIAIQLRQQRKRTRRRRPYRRHLPGTGICAGNMQYRRLRLDR